MHSGSENPGLVVALALAAGLVAQSIAQHIRVPGIVVLLAAGVLLGPDGLGVIEPSALGGALHVLVGFAIAVILFEGGLNLEWRRLRREAATIQRLITIGAVITAVGGAAAARLVLGWAWAPSILFGTLVIVTGPTVITPLLRRIKVRRDLETILEAEGVFIDAIGAIIAVVALEVVLNRNGSSLALGFVDVPTRLVVGAGLGLAGGAVIAVLLRFRGVLPEGLENVFTLSTALAVYQTSNTISSESGIVAVIVAGLVVGNARSSVHHELKEFKEQLTVMLIGMLFVLLAAEVRIADVAALGAPGLLVVAALMFVVRPVGIAACTLRSSLTWRDKAFLSWLAPRGIVAAAVSTLFYDRMEAGGLSGGAEMRSLVFLVIAVTVVFQGLTSGWVASLLRLRRPSGQGYVILGAHRLGIALAGALRDGGEEVVLIDTSPSACHEAEEEGFKVFHGNALEERVTLGADLGTRKAVIATLGNGAVNLLFARKARDRHKVPAAYVAIQRGAGAISPQMIEEAGASVLFGDETDLELWDVRIRRGMAVVKGLRHTDTAEEGGATIARPKDKHGLVLPLIYRRDRTIAPVDERLKPRLGDEVLWLVFREREEEADAWLEQAGWMAAPAAENDDRTPRDVTIS